jgi:hypothetical protein
LRQGIIPAGIINVLGKSDRKFGVDEVLIILNKLVPLMVFWHCNRSSPQLLNCIVSPICLPSEDASIGIIGLLDLANNDGLEFSSRRFKIQIGLAIISNNLRDILVVTYLMKIVLLVDLLLNLAIHSEL